MLKAIVTSSFALRRGGASVPMYSLHRHAAAAMSTAGASTPASTRVDAKALLKKAQAVCFDVDSTVIQDEGIDVLAAFKNAGPAVAELTKKYVPGL